MTENRKYKIQGTISSERDSCGLPNLKVEAWDKDLVIDDLLGSAKTDENGRITLSFDETYYQEVCVDRKPDVYFKVFYEGKLIKSQVGCIPCTAQRWEWQQHIWTEQMGGNDETLLVCKTHPTINKVMHH